MTTHDGNQSVAGAFIIGGLAAMVLGALIVARQMDEFGGRFPLLIGWALASLGWATFLAGMIGVAVRGPSPSGGTAADPVVSDKARRLRDLKAARDAGALPVEDYEAARRKILDER